MTESETYQEAAARYPKLYEHGAAPAWSALGRARDRDEKPLYKSGSILGDNAQRQFMAARAWLRARSNPENGGGQEASSYGLKHRFESWCRRQGEDEYITNGLFILAALEEGYPGPASWDTSNPNIRIRTYLTDGRAEPAACFWEFVVSRRARDNPRGDFIRETRDVLESQYADTDSRNDAYRGCDGKIHHADEEVRAEYDALLCQWQRFRHEMDSAIAVCSSPRISFAASETDGDDEYYRQYDVMLDGSLVGSVSQAEEDEPWYAETARHMGAGPSCSGRSRHDAVDALLAESHRWKEREV